MITFIDGGGHCGCSLKKAAGLGYTSMVSYEADPLPFAKLEQVAPALAARAFNLALWDRNTRLPFYRDQPSRWRRGSTLLEDKFTGEVDYSMPITVEAIDIVEVMAGRPAQSVDLKLDVEGAEYAILERLLSVDALSPVRRLFIEFHNTHIDSPAIQRRHRDCLRGLLRAGVRPHYWDAKEHCGDVG